MLPARRRSPEKPPTGGGSDPTDGGDFGGGGDFGDPDRNPKQDRMLSPREITMLQNGNIDVHGLKGGKNASSYDLYKDPAGNIYVKPKGGDGPGNATGLNINDFGRR